LLLVFLWRGPSLLKLGREVEFAAFSIRANVGSMERNECTWNQRQFATGASWKLAVE
jgi:hypothetical protein